MQRGVLGHRAGCFPARRAVAQRASLPHNPGMPDDIVAVTKQLTVEMAEQAYRNGLFPMYIPSARLYTWHKPDPRAIIPLDGFHLSRRLAKTLRQGKFEITCDRDFAGVMQGCAEGRPVWIGAKFFEVYGALHAQGKAHSVEVWQHGKLVGRHLRRPAWRGLLRRIQVPPRDRREQARARRAGRPAARTRLRTARSSVPDAAPAAVWHGRDRLGRLHAPRRAGHAAFLPLCVSLLRAGSWVRGATTGSRTSNAGCLKYHRLARASCSLCSPGPQGRATRYE